MNLKNKVKILEIIRQELRYQFTGNQMSVCVFGPVFRRNMSVLRWRFKRSRDRIENFFGQSFLDVSYRIFYRCPGCERVNSMGSHDVNRVTVKEFSLGFIGCTTCCSCRLHFGTYLVDYDNELTSLHRSIERRSVRRRKRRRDERRG